MTYNQKFFKLTNTSRAYYVIGRYQDEAEKNCGSSTISVFTKWHGDLKITNHYWQLNPSSTCSAFLDKTCHKKRIGIARDKITISDIIYFNTFKCLQFFIKYINRESIIKLQFYSVCGMTTYGFTSDRTSTNFLIKINKNNSKIILVSCKFCM